MLSSQVSFTLARCSLLRAVHEIVDRRATYPKVPNLTDRELHVFALIGAGFGTTRIAHELGIIPKTVETYHEHIKLKLGYRNAHALHRGVRGNGPS